MGDQNKYKHTNKKIPHSPGRSYKGKKTVFGARSLTGEVRTKVIPNVEAATIIPVIDNWMEKGSIMVSDERKAYRGLKQDYFHVIINNSEGEYVRGRSTTNGIEIFWSLFKRGIIDTHHSISPKHCQKYTNEFASRYNNKNKTSNERFGQFIGIANQKRVTYRELTSNKKPD